MSNAFARPGVAYLLRGAMYLSLTDKSNAASLITLRGPSFSVPKASGFVPLGVESNEPNAQELVNAVDRFYDSLNIGSSGESDPGVIFAGAGEPLLRKHVLLEAVREIRERRHGARLRVSTNGLHDLETCDELFNAGLREVSVYVASANPEEYTRLMAPTDGRGLGDALQFVERCSSNGIEVEVTCSKAPGVDLGAVREVAMACGAVKFREREYFQ